MHIGVKNAALCLKKYHKYERQLCLETHNFTKLLQNMCLINTHILVYRYARCNCKFILKNIEKILESIFPCTTVLQKIKSINELINFRFKDNYNEINYEIHLKYTYLSVKNGNGNKLFY